jgi:hypothetical protein
MRWDKGEREYMASLLQQASDNGQPHQGSHRVALHTTDVPEKDGGRVITIETAAYADVPASPKLSPTEEFDRKLNALLKLTGKRHANIDIAYGVFGFHQRQARGSQAQSHHIKQAKEHVIGSVNSNFRLKSRKPSSHHINRLSDQKNSGYLSGNLDIARLAAGLNGYNFGIELVLYGCDVANAQRRGHELIEKVERYQLHGKAGWALYAGNRDAMERHALGDLHRLEQ